MYYKVVDTFNNSRGDDFNYYAPRLTNLFIIGGIILTSKYIDYIVAQGNAINTSLEHLKFTFLKKGKKEQGSEISSTLQKYNKENNTEYDELSFNKFTQVYHTSSEIQKIVEPFKNLIVMSSPSVGLLLNKKAVSGSCAIR